MKEFLLETQQLISKPREEVFEFFSNAENLEFLTPDFLNFNILTKLPIKMQEGTEIEYKLKLYGVPIKWKSLITSWNPFESFVDEQIKGPYAKWVHTHIFESIGRTCLVKDRVNYKVLGDSLTNKIFVSSNLRTIFQYRTNRLMEYFAEPSGNEKANHDSVKITVA
ncbi:uncharacterized protein METZ01_LOCUS390441 [marine metagenome]|uniref:Coenzyme Q-binding protein COQ10 START domain-containing protein n=1 Tax=marine metagenome TaxID=408172 RepID=A0A382UTY0_9ZZZZ